MSSPPLTIPHTQNTAPVLEFRCLYTQDIRRKQKRWQDGRLKFHTFNKRVMVYDDRSNFVGDTHWREDSGLREGDELELDRGGMLVQVGDCIGTRDQDLSELVDKRVKEKEQRAAARAAASPARPRSSLAHLPVSTPAGLSYPKPKPLNAVIGTPTGHYGRAMASNLSPFQQNQQENRVDAAVERPAKRRKQNETPASQNGYARNLTGATLTLASTRPPNTQTIHYEPFRTATQRPDTQIIDLTKEEGSKEMSRSAILDEAPPRSPPLRAPRVVAGNPPSKGGYASNLTGVVLTLSGTEALTSRRAHQESRARVRDTVPPQDARSLTAVTAKSGVTDTDSCSDKAATAVPKAKQAGRGNTLDAATQLIPNSTPEPGAIIRNKVVQDVSATKLMVEHPVTTLRIKSRPRQKLMMLMEVSSIRRSAGGASSDESRRFGGTNIARQSALTVGVAPSHAAARLDSFDNKQEKLLEARLKGKRQTLDLGEFSPSPVDGDMMDIVPSRENIASATTRPANPAITEHAEVPMKCTAAQKVRERAYETIPAARSLSTPSSGSVLPEIGQNYGENTEESQPRAQKSVTGFNNSAALLCSISGASGDELNFLDRGMIPSLGAESPRTNKTGSPKSEEARPEQGSFERTIDTRVPQPSVAVDREDFTAQPVVGLGRDEVARPAAAGMTAARDDRAAPPNFTRSAQKISRHPSCSSHRVANLPSQSRGAELHVRPSPQAAAREQEALYGGGLAHQKMELTSSGVAIKHSPKPSPIVATESDPNTGRTETTGPASIPQFKARLVNPATRGASVRATAKRTHNMIAPRVAMANAVAAQSHLPERVENDSNRGGEPSGAQEIGPWSRESFDLFGSWRPPETAPSTDVLMPPN